MFFRRCRRRPRAALSHGHVRRRCGRRDALTPPWRQSAGEGRGRLELRLDEGGAREARDGGRAQDGLGEPLPVGQERRLARRVQLCTQSEQVRAAPHRAAAHARAPLLPARHAGRAERDFASLTIALTRGCAESGLRVTRSPPPPRQVDEMLVEKMEGCDDVFVDFGKGVKYQGAKRI